MILKIGSLGCRHKKNIMRVVLYLRNTGGRFIPKTGIAAFHQWPLFILVFNTYEP